VRGLEPLCEQILRDKHIVGLDTRDAARVLPLALQLERTALSMFLNTRSRSLGGLDNERASRRFVLE
jgi:hypothetical protein